MKLALERFRLYCKHSFYRYAYGMKLPFHRVLAAKLWQWLYARPLPSALRSRR